MLDANVSGAPVVNQSGQLVGVLTEADVIWKVKQHDIRVATACGVQCWVQHEQHCQCGVQQDWHAA